MRFGLFHTVQWPQGTSQADRFREAMEHAIHAEELGFEAIWLTEHHFTRHGMTSDSLALLSYLAAETERVRLGSAVSVLPFHNPIRLAESVATVDVISNGRLDFGIGRGYQWTEYHGFNLHMKQGSALFDESIGLAQRAWTAQAPFNHDGEHWHFEDVEVLPRPLQSPHPPIWLATASASGLRRAAREGWNVMLPQGRARAEVADQIATYKAALADEGQPFDPPKLVLARALYVAEDDETAWTEAEPAYHAFRNKVRRMTVAPQERGDQHNPFDTESVRDSAVFGSPESCVAKLREIAELGVKYVILFVHMGGLKHEPIMRSMDLVAQEVMPRVVSQEEVAQ